MGAWHAPGPRAPRARARWGGGAAGGAGPRPRGVAELLGRRLVLREEGSGTREILERQLAARDLSVADFAGVIELASIPAIKACVAAGAGVSFLYRVAVEGALARGARIYAEVIGFGTNSDGAHITTPQSAQMAAAMRLALEDAGIAPEDVDCVNGHGTATDRGDVAESLATYEVFGGRTPYTTYKGHMGHTLGACGALEAIFSIRGMIDGIVSPVLNLEHPDAACAPLNFVTGGVKPLEQRIVMSNNFAFGGINTSLIFRKWRPGDETL